MSRTSSSLSSPTAYSLDGGATVGLGTGPPWTINLAGVTAGTHTLDLVFPTSNNNNNNATFTFGFMVGGVSCTGSANVTIYYKNNPGYTCSA